MMEDEYRNEKEPAQPYPAKRNASTDALRGTPDPATNGDASDAEETGPDDDDEEPEENGAKGQADANSLAPTLVANGQTEDLEKPSSTVDPEEVKKADENVRLSN